MKYKGFEIKRKVTRYFGKKIKNMLENISENVFESAEEIRVRLDRPIYLKCALEERFFGENGITDIKNAYIPVKEDIIQILELISRFSLYAFEDEIRQGYIPLPNGFRVGIAGRTVVENGGVKTIKNISGFNFRIPKEVIGCSEKIIDYIAVPQLRHTLIVSPPCAGKTTLLRDIIRMLSNGVDGKFKGVTVGVADERSEIAGSFRGAAQNDVGMRTDVLDGCPKAQGMLMLLRAMSPNVIAADEIGSSEDLEAVLNVLNAGVKVVCTIHAENIEDLNSKYIFEKIRKNKIFERYIFLSNRMGAGTIEGIFDGDFLRLDGEKKYYLRFSVLIESVCFGKYKCLHDYSELDSFQVC